MESSNSTSAELISKAKCICGGFQSLDRKVRKECYAHLTKFLVDCQKDGASDQVLRDIFTETHVYFLNGLRDKSEAVREEGVKFIICLVTKLYPLNDYYLTYIFPIIVERIGSPEMVEESEELRLSMLTLLNNIIVKYAGTEYLKPFFNDCVIVLCETLKDKYSAIKELSCQAVVNLSEALKSDFHLQAESLLKPTLSCFSYQKYKVRVGAVKAVGAIVMHSTYKGVDEAMGPMAERLFDEIPEVRRTVAQVASSWLLKHRDRYSYFHKMLPLILTGLNDEVPATRAEAHELWNKIGHQYMMENEKDLKDKMDYLTELPKYYPANLQRPNLGCRVLVQRNLSKLAVPLSNELCSWQADVRVRCSQLLCSLIVNAEEDFTFNIQNLLPAMYSAAKDDDKRVVDNIKRASQLIGTFVTYEVWSKVVLPAIEDEPNFGHLIVLAGLIEGSDIKAISIYLEELSGILAQDNVCYSYKMKYSLALWDCIKAISDKCQASPNETTSFNLFKVITCLISLCHQDLRNEINEELYIKVLGHESLANHFNKLIIHINREPRLWTKSSEDQKIFTTLLTQFSLGIGIDKDAILDILKEALHEEADAQSRLTIFYILAHRFERKALLFKDETVNIVGVFLERLINEILIPALEWRAGATAEAIRTMAISCLKEALTLDFLPNNSSATQDTFNSDKRLQQVMKNLTPTLVSLLDDASHNTRCAAIKSLEALQQRCATRKLQWDSQCDDFINIYSGVIKRLDDPIETVRISAFQCLLVLFHNAPSEFLELNFKNHRELIVDTLLTHLDDDNDVIRDLALQCLKVATRMGKSEVLDKAMQSQPLLTNKSDCEDLIEYINKMEFSQNTKENL